MHVSHIVSRRGEKEYHSWLIRRSYRENGKVKHETVANISKLPMATIDAIKLTLADKCVIEAGSDFEIVATKKLGATALLLALARQSSLSRALGKDPKRSSLALAMIIAQALNRSSKLAMTSYLPTTTLPEDLGIEVTDVDRYYETLDWLGANQERIESALIRDHLGEGSMLLYDLSSSYMEGTKCPLAHYGYSRDKKRGKLQIEYGVLATTTGLPLGVRVFPGNTSDLASFRSVVDDLAQTYGLAKIIIVGDRGMFSAANISHLAELDPSYLYVSALRSTQIRSLINDGAIRLGLFDATDLFEITHPDYPGERLMVAKNEALGKRRGLERRALLSVAIKRLDALVVSVEAKRVKSEAAIGRRIESALASTKMAKHIHTEVGPESFRYSVDEASIAAEARLDGIYVVRTTVGPEDASCAEIVSYYKNLANIERTFRSMKSIDIEVRPVRHYLETRVRAHVFLCVLAAHLLHLAKERLAELTFRDEDPPVPVSPVAKKVVSTSAKNKAAKKV
ncbi:MAG: IS1634 family transposase, partial [Ferrimicrobium sp.]